MHLTALFLILTFGGLIDSVYLLYANLIKKKPLVCPIGHNCSVVTNSKWSTIFFGIRNEILGVLFYAGMMAVMIATIVAPDLIPHASLLLIGATGGGVLFSAFLVYLQAYVIKDYCFYCMISAGLTALMFLTSLALHFGWGL